ncbi:MAG: site-2 protease family protein [Clostridia bacterium]|nr:site-2 protease family protein [Clostridia bacterium]
MSILYFLIALLVLALMIFIHELGHYTAGRLLGFKILDFSIGFGPAIFQFKKKDINYALRAIPLGGACRFYGEEDDPIDAVSFNSQKPWKRMIVIFAGPFMNFVLAYVLSVIMLLCFGNRDYLRYGNGDYAITVNAVTEESPAEKAGVLPEDVILFVNGADVENSGESFEEKTDAISAAIGSAPAEGLAMTVLRGDETVELFVPDIYSEKEQRNFLGISMGVTETYEKCGLWGALKGGFGFMGTIVKTTFEAIANGFRNGFNQGDFSGPVATVAITMKMASMGVYYLLVIMILISMSLGIMNLLPILPMDGGHLLFDFIELVIGKPVPRAVQNTLSMIGFGLLILLMIYVTIGDVRGIFNGMFS